MRPAVAGTASGFMFPVGGECSRKVWQTNYHQRIKPYHSFRFNGTCKVKTSQEIGLGDRIFIFGTIHAQEQSLE
jgi:hypothetical protein